MRSISSVRELRNTIGSALIAASLRMRRHTSVPSSSGIITSRITRSNFCCCAAASACGANPVAVLVPCHRVLCSNGDLGGYNGGVAIKKALLAHEQALSDR